MSVFVTAIKDPVDLLYLFGQSPQELRLSGNVCPGAFGGCDYDPDDRIVLSQTERKNLILQ